MVTHAKAHVIDDAEVCPLPEEPEPVPVLIFLGFDGEFTAKVRARVSYAFRVFAAIYNYRVVETRDSAQTLCCIYTKTPTGSSRPDALTIPSRYRIRPNYERVENFTERDYAGEKFYLAYGIDESTENPDWLGEIFDWLSCSYELAATTLDAVGRIPYSETVFGQFGITARRPYANLLMAWMENALRNGNSKPALPKAPSPVSTADHIVLCSHDIDFCYTGKRAALVRVLKNLVISWRPFRSLSFCLDNARLLFDIVRGKRVGDYLSRLILEIDRLGFKSTFFAVSRRGHRRDPHYRVDQLASFLLDATKKGFAVGVHGSYRSVIEETTLPDEARSLANILKEYPRGGRQHWLRFAHHQILFREIERANLIFDSTLGFADHVGFRNGASFAYPPYDFENEAPFSFLEFPLALMDGSIEAECRVSREDPQTVADEVLNESRRWGWGGLSVVWHNPVEPIQVPREINRVFWNCANQRNKFKEEWLSTNQFFDRCLSRYHSAGLLEGITFRA